MTPTPFRRLDDLGPDDRAASGGKAFQCGRLRQAGFSVPDGLVVLAHATAEEIAGLDSQPWFDEQPPEAVFAVRSSALDEDGSEQSFAGIHETHLNVPRRDVAAAVAACRASVQSAHALTYRRARGMPAEGIATGVLIQRMILPVAAGVAFTVNPVTGASDEFVINSSWGVGEAVVSGQIDPDEFYVRKIDGEVVGSRVGGKGTDAAEPSMTRSQLCELGAVLSRIESHYDAPQDVEWCHDGRQFWILQSRPVTASASETSGTEWTRANLAEVLPDLTSPQALAAFEDLLNRAERLYMGRLMTSEPMVRSFNGRMYFNLSQLRHICELGGVAPADVLRSMGHPGMIRRADEVLTRAPLPELIRHIPDFIRLGHRHLRIATFVRRHERRIADILGRWSQMDAASLTDEALWSIMDGWSAEAPAHMQIVLTLGGVLFHEAPLRKLCDGVGYSYEALMYPQLAAGERSVSAQQAFDLVALADLARREPAARGWLSTGSDDLGAMRAELAGTAFLGAFEDFLRKYGHRGRYESDWSLPRYSEDPAPLLFAVRAHLASAAAGDRPGSTEAEQADRAAAAWRAFEQHLTWWQRWTVLPRARARARWIKRYYLWRERCRSDMMKVVAVLRKWHLVLAARFVERGWIASTADYFLLKLDEVGEAIRIPQTAGRLRAIAAARAADVQRYRRIPMPLLMREAELPRLIATSGIAGSGDPRELTGHGVSAGSVEAEVAVILDPADFDRMTRGAILVTRATDPSWTPLFTLASGVIVEVGGVLSHASTIAREFGLPALANVRHATKLLRTGDRVRLDATRGIVTKLR